MPQFTFRLPDVVRPKEELDHIGNFETFWTISLNGDTYRKLLTCLWDFRPI